MSATATATRVFGLGRAVYGTSLIIKPAVFARPWIGREAERPTVELAVRALGVRDAALGLGSLLTAGDSLSQRPWLAAGAISDLVDMGATIAAGRSIPERSRQGVAIFAAMSSLAGAVLYANRQKEAAH